MDKEEFKFYRKQLEKTQKQIAQLLGVSIKAIHSYEQGWRSIPGHIERQLFFLIFKKSGRNKEKPCWEHMGRLHPPVIVFDWSSFIYSVELIN